jgi:hypothetical protein
MGLFCWHARGQLDWHLQCITPGYVQEQEGYWSGLALRCVRVLWACFAGVPEGSLIAVYKE